MPPIGFGGWIWIAAIAVVVALFMRYAAPRLAPVMASKIRHDHEDARMTKLDWIALYVSSLAMFLIAAIVAIMLFEITARYVFFAPTLWVNELSLWFGGVVYLTAGLYAMQQRAHIRITLVYDALPRSLQRLCDLVATACVVGFAAAVIWGYWDNAMKRFMRWEGLGTAWNPPIPAIMTPLTLIATGCLAVLAINNLVADWSRDKAAPHNPADDL